ncbi:MAG TPA: hypothetical protein VFQ65_26970, partial [Kofleriaceae bacterium]|nr:hypothetical protein [Kofleriaceae bacterium]
MPAVRPWYVIPLLGIAGAAVAFSATHQPAVAVAFGLCGAALAAAIRAFLGPALVGAIAAAGGATLGVIDLVAVAPHVRAALAGAAGLFALSELARARQPNASPLPAAGAAVLAAVLDPSYVGLVAVSGIAWVIAPVPRPRGVIALPILGGIATVLAIVLACGQSGVWHAWLGHATAHRDVLATVLRAGDLVGPIAACAALAGVA